MKLKLAAVEESVKGRRVFWWTIPSSGAIPWDGWLSCCGTPERRDPCAHFLAAVSASCYYGTDIDSEEHLIACRHSIEETCRIIGANSLGYFPVEKLGCLTGNRGFCSACFDGKYPTSIPADTRKDRFEAGCRMWKNERRFACLM